MNSVALVGRLTRAPELRSTGSGKSVCGFAIAVDRQGGGQDDKADFFEIVVWERQAETCVQYLIKGQRVAVVGRLQNRSWTAQDGTPRKSTEVVATNVEFLDKPKGEGGGERGEYHQREQVPAGGGWGGGGQQQQQQQQAGGWDQPQQGQGGWAGNDIPY